MKIRKVIICLICICFVFVVNNFWCVNADGGMEQDIIDTMISITTAVDTTSGIGYVINIIIGGLQLAGSGIAIIVVTMLGTKYMLASVEDKAEIKKQAIPIVIGCILLFGAVNLMGALADTTDKVLK